MQGNSPRDIMIAFEQKFIDALQASLEKNDKATPGTLWQSVKANTKVFGQSVVLEISMNDYWKFVEKGVDGTMIKHGSPFKFKASGKAIPKSAIDKFIANRGLPHKKKGLAFLIGRSIKRKGIKPTHFASDVMEGSLMKEFSRELNLAVGREIKLTIAQNEL